MLEPGGPAAAAGDGGLIRLRLDLAYDGTAFSGWARQPGRHTVAEAPDGFDARFGALWRRYRYRLADDLSERDPLRRVDTFRWPRPLNAETMAEAAAGLVGEHDFVAFCRRRAGAGTVRTLLE